MSYLETVKNFSNCPLKKRPLQYLLETNDSHDANEPQDLRVKRRRECDGNNQELQNHFLLPSIAEGSLSSQLSSAKDFTKLENCTISSNDSEVIHTDLPNYSSNMTQNSRIPPLADFYLQLFQQSTSQSVKRDQVTQNFNGVWPLHPFNMAWKTNSLQCSSWAAAAPVSPSTESHLSSPRSISSEDSGMGSEFVSEDEIEIDKDELRIPQRHICDSCSKSYSTEAGLRKHNELHCTSLGPKTFYCKHCSKSYTSIGALKMHIRTHTLPCKCHVCGKAFSRPWLLQGHIRTHTGEKPFECQQCHRSFADRSNLRAHQQTHERVKKYACHTCKKTFSRMSLLNKHTENACPGNLPSTVK